MEPREHSASTGRLALTSGATQLASRLFDVAVTWLLSIVVLRYLAPSGFGEYALIVGLVGLAGVFAEFGLPQVAAREIARDPAVEPAVIGSAIVIRLVMGALSIAAVQVLLGFYSPTSEMRWAALIASGAFLVDAVLSIVVVFQVRLVQQFEAAARLVGTLVRAGLTVAVVVSDGGLVGLLGAQLVSLVAVAVVSVHLLRTRTTSRPRANRDQVRVVGRAALAVGPAALIGVLYLKLDVVMLGLLEDRASVGIYGAAYQPIEYLLLLTAVVVQVLLPLAAAVAREHHGDFTARYRFGVDILAASYGLMAVGIVALAPDAVRFLYSTPFAGAAEPMMILGLAIGFMAVNAWQGIMLLTIGQQHRNLIYLSVAAVLNVALDIVFINAYGYIGAAYGTLVSALVLVAMSSAGVRRHADLSFGPAPALLLVAAGSGCFTALIVRTQLGSSLLAVAAGVMMWAAIAWFALPSLRAGARNIAASKVPVASDPIPQVGER